MDLTDESSGKRFSRSFASDWDREESPDETWRKAIRNINREFDPILKMRDQTKQLDGSARDAHRAAAVSAFDKYKLPPITPLEKFRALASRGQRDGFDG